MKTIAVHIRESDKGDRDLTLHNLREEIVGFMYRQTVSRSTKADMQFYILLFYASIGSRDKTALEVILDEGLPKFNSFTEALSNRRGYLRRNEYADLKSQFDLDELFYKDMFFVISEGILNLDEIEKRFHDILDRDEFVVAAFSRVRRNYLPELKALFDTFSGSRIEDTRIDDDGNVHDLSKSVYRTVYMRSSRNLELNLQKYTSVKKIESNSPIEFTFLQFVDPNAIIHLWDKYDVAHYMMSTVKIMGKAANSPIGTGTISGTISGLILAYINERRTKRADDRKAKRVAKTELEIETNKHRKEIDELNVRLVESVLDSNEALRTEIKHLRSDLNSEIRKSRALREDKKIKALSLRLGRLEKLIVETEVVEGDGTQTSLL